MEASALDSQPQIVPLLRQNGVRPERLVEVLRCDSEPESLKFVKLWDKLTLEMRKLAGLEAIAMGSGITPRRLWELFCGARLMQSREAVGFMIADAQPEIVRVTIKRAKQMKGVADREHFYKASGFLPTPKGSVTTVNVGQPQSQLEEKGLGEGGQGELESADEFMLSAAKVMQPKSLPPVPDPEPEAEPEDEDDEDGSTGINL